MHSDPWAGSGTFLKDVTMKFRIPFSGRGHRYTPEDIETVVSVMQDTDTLTQGRHRIVSKEKCVNISEFRTHLHAVTPPLL